MCVVTMMEQRRVRSNEVVASTTGRRSRGGDALIVSRAMSMSPGSSDENDSQEMVNIRAQFSKVVDSSNDEEDMAVEIRRRRAAGESTPLGSHREHWSSSSSTSTTNSISSFMQEGGVYNSQIGKEKPLKINQDLLIEEAKRIRNQSLYARTRKERRKLRDAAIETFKRAMVYDPADGRAYVGIGKIYVQQKDYNKAREVYENGTRATGSENAYLWQAFATLEKKAGNVQQARKYFDAAVIANRNTQPLGTDGAS